MAFSHLYGIFHDDAVHILDTSPVLQRDDERAHDGGYRTKRVILKIYDSLAEAASTGRP